jgi:probable addiction module antidote protein
MSAASEPFDFSIRDKLLQDPEHAALYLAECLEDGDIALFQEALRNVAKAQEGGVRAVAAQADLSRENLYRALSKKGKPQLETVTKMLSALGLRFTITPAQH